MPSNASGAPDGSDVDAVHHGLSGRSAVFADKPSATDLLAEIRSSLNALEKRAAAVSTSYVASGSDRAAMRLAQAASDVVAIGRTLVAAQESAITSTANLAAQVDAIAPGVEWIITETSSDLEALQITWKAWFFFVRALCDHLYGFLLASVEGRHGRSMNKAINPGNPVAKILADEVPGFIAWFVRFRDQRNEVKEGVNFGFTALAGAGISVTFNVFRFDADTSRRSVLIDSSGDRKVSLGDVLEAVGMLGRGLAVLQPRTATPPSELPANSP